jgi:hypothetical protein
VKWTRSETLALAQHDCLYCFGLGMRLGKNRKQAACNCVLRHIFRCCYRRFRDCAAMGGSISQCAYVVKDGARSNIWSMVGQEYAADFCLIARRALSDSEFRLFSLHYLDGGDWHQCAPLLHMNRGEFWHEVYRIQQKLGRRFRELEPYALWPLDEYFGGTVRAKEIEHRFPLAMAA